MFLFKKKKPTLLFDFDGTLFDTKESLIPCYKYGFNAIGLDCTKEECYQFMHLSLSQTAELKHVEKEKLDEFSDQKLGDGVTYRLIVAINLGVLNDFIKNYENRHIDRCTRTSREPSEPLHRGKSHQERPR
mgnify:CR=1 FL=1